MDAFQWTGDRAAFERWFGSPCPIDARECVSVPTGDRGGYLRVWCGSWILRKGDRCGVISDWAMRYMCEEYHMDLPVQPPSQGASEMRT